MKSSPHVHPPVARRTAPGGVGVLGAAALLAVLLAAPAPGRAERADSRQPVTIEADRPGVVDLQKQVVTFSGNVVIVQGTIRIQADRVEVREGPDGFRSAVALGAPNQPATFRQKRDGVDETIEGRAERVEYDGRGDTVRLIGGATVRRLQGSTPADEITGHTIVYDNVAQVFSVQGAAAGSPGGRVRAVLAPRPASAAGAGTRSDGAPASAPGERR